MWIHLDPLRIWNHVFPGGWTVRLMWLTTVYPLQPSVLADVCLAVLEMRSCVGRDVAPEAAAAIGSFTTHVLYLDQHMLFLQLGSNIRILYWEGLSGSPISLSHSFNESSAVVGESYIRVSRSWPHLAFLSQWGTPKDSQPVQTDAVTSLVNLWTCFMGQLSQGLYLSGPLLATVIGTKKDILVQMWL